MRSLPKAWLFPLLIIGVSGYLACQGLGDNYFWDDEAGTAIFAKNLLRFGKLTAWDGRNLMAYRNGMELDNNLINKYVPPLQLFLAAASFRLLGISTFSGRLPFVVVGLLSLWFFFLILRLESGEKSNFSLYGLALLAFSPSFLLYIRQCRYFSLAIFFPLFVYYFYKKYVYTQKLWCLALVTAGLVGLFFSHFLICVAFSFALLGLHASYYLRSQKLFPYLVAALVFVGLILVYIFGYGVIFPLAEPVGGKKWLIDKLTLLARNFREINAYNLFPWMMLIVLIWLGIDRRFDRLLKRRVKEWLLLIVLFVICLTIFSPQAVFTRGGADVRYLAALLPFFAALLGLIVFFLYRKSKIAAVTVFLILIFTNLFSLNFWFPRPLRWDLFNYIKEIHQDYITAYETTVQFIEKNCRRNDVIVVIPPNMSYPLQFYTGDKVLFGGRLDKSTTLPLDVVRKLNPSLILEEAQPDWIISFRMRQMTADLLDYYAGQGIEFSLCEVLNVFFLGELIRPEILLHGFEPVTQFRPESEGVLIFKRR